MLVKVIMWRMSLNKYTNPLVVSPLAFVLITITVEEENRDKKKTLATSWDYMCHEVDAKVHNITCICRHRCRDGGRPSNRPCTGRHWIGRLCLKRVKEKTLELEYCLIEQFMV